MADLMVSTNIFNDRRIRQIESLPSGDTVIVVWIKLLELAAKTNDMGFIYLTKNIPYTDNMLANEFGRPLSVITYALDILKKYEMIGIKEDTIHVRDWEQNK